ncbi:MAG: GNAT family N-acetyltransferase [Lachnospiraceae bacterium]|nr:GNAT family N-acetyltransferase [Lachnospiraceae bacterium]
MQVEIYNFLPKEAKRIREEVFMAEQGFQQEFDEIDKSAEHIVIFETHIPVATCRVYVSENEDCYVVGRIAVEKTFRGKAYGAGILRAAENEVRKKGGRMVCLSAQERAVGFYEKQGYTAYGDSYLDEGCPHIWMKKELI